MPTDGSQVCMQNTKKGPCLKLLVQLFEYVSEALLLSFSVKMPQEREKQSKREKEVWGLLNNAGRYLAANGAADQEKAAVWQQQSLALELL